MSDEREASELLDLDALELVAKAADYEGLHWERTNSGQVIHTHPFTKEVFIVADGVWDDDDREHIAALDPPTVLALLAELRTLRAAESAHLLAVCEWTETEEGYWFSEHDKEHPTYWSEDGGLPNKAGIRFCHGCGKLVEAVPYVEEVEEDEDE